MFNEQSFRFQVVCANPKGVLERGEVMRVKSHYTINAHRLEKAGDVARRDRVSRFAFLVLARVAKVRDDSRDAFGGSVAQRAEEEQEPAELIVHALPVVAIQRLDNEDILAANIYQRSYLMLAVFELSLLVRAQRNA
jgi:hypothetical protein